MKYGKSRFVYAVLFYLLVVALIYVSRPESLFAEDGRRIRRQGLMPEETLFPLSMVCLAVAIASYTIFTVIDVVFD